MSLAGIWFSQVVLTGLITDTAAHNSAPIVMDYLEESVVVIQNTLDQNVTIVTQYSDDGGATWSNIGSTYVANAGTSMVANQYDQTLSGIKLLAGQLRFVATAGTAPTTGNLKITFQGMSD